MINKKFENGEFFIEVPEIFNFDVSREFRRAYESLDKGTEALNVVTVDFSSTRVMDSSALGMLLVLRSYFEDVCDNVRLVNCDTHVAKLLSVAKYDRYFSITSK